MLNCLNVNECQVSIHFERLPNTEQVYHGRTCAVIQYGDFYTNVIRYKISNPY